MKVLWTASADQDRSDIRAYIAKDNPRDAIRMDDLFEAAAARLAEFPNLGRRGRLAGTRELIPHRSYRLVYRVESETVAVVRVIHTARHWPA